MEEPLVQAGDAIGQRVQPNDELQPLGRAYLGRCHAAGPAQEPPSGEAQIKLCNHGYARGLCERFPKDHDVDANRFSRTQNGIVWIEEAAYAPLRFGAASEAKGKIIRIQMRKFEENK